MGKWSLSLWGVLFVVLFAAACGSSKERGFDDGTGGDPGGSSSGTTPPLAASGTIVVEPPDQVIDVTDGKTPSVDYHAFLVDKDGKRTDVTAAAHWSVEPHGGQTYGTFAGPKFTASPTGVGKTQIKARHQNLTGQTNVVLHLTKSIVVAGAPPDAASKFAGVVDPARAPSIVYPSDGVIVPPNMNEIEWHFRPNGGADLFDLAVKSLALDLHVYFVCTAVGGGCAYAPDKTVWAILSSAGRGDDPLDTKLRGASKAGGGYGESPKQTLAFGEEDIVGGIYYWNAAVGATMRYEFGVSGQKAETYMNAPKAGAATCVGCHVLSRDGERISLGMDIPAPSPYKVFDVKTSTMVYGSQTAGTPGANFFTFSPDKKEIMVSNGVFLSLRNGSTGAAIIENVANGAMPDWSPDGKSVVFAQPKVSPPCFGAICGAPGVSEAGLFTTTNVGGKWSAASVLVPTTSNNNFYPSYSPDGGWVAFNRASIGTLPNGDSRSSYDAPDATVWVVKSTGGTPIALTKATSANGDSWPKWMQREQDYRGKKLMWLTFSSRRAYGLRVGAGSTAQIWMVAFDPAAAAAGKDPTYAAFWLPFQETGSGNHIAQWVTKVERKGCTDSTQCEGSEACIDAVCRPTIK